MAKKADKQIIKELREKVRELEQQLREFDDIEYVAPVKRPKLDPCHSCGKGFMEDINILDRHWKSCTICGERTKAKRL